MACFAPLRAVLESVGIAHCIFDLGVGAAGGAHAGRLVVIELNSFGMRSGSALFDWDDAADCDVLIGAVEGAPPAVRVVEAGATRPPGSTSVLSRTQKLCSCDA